MVDQNIYFWVETFLQGKKIGANHVGKEKVSQQNKNSQAKGKFSPIRILNTCLHKFCFIAESIGSKKLSLTLLPMI